PPDPRRMGGPGDRLRRRRLAQRRQRRPGRVEDRAGGADGGDRRVGLRLDLEPRPRPAVAVHVRGRADARRRHAHHRRGLGPGRTLRRHAHAQGHALGRLPGQLRLDRRLQRLHLVAAQRAPGAGRQLRLRQSRDRGAARRLAGARALQHRRTGGDGRDPARRGRDQPGQGAQATAAGAREGGCVSAERIDRRGIWVAVAAYVIWGVMPLYWHLLKAVPSLQIIMHRIVWSTVLVAGWLGWRYGRGWIRQTLALPRAAWMLAISGMLIAFNWGLYIWAVNAGHVVETSLGYFINPLINVVLGVVLLRERLTRMQWVAVGIATCGVLWLTFNYGSFPWIAI